MKRHLFIATLLLAATAAHVGERAEVIVDGVEENDGVREVIGHAWFQAPDSDGAVHLDADEVSDIRSTSSSRRMVGAQETEP